jgi:hypothetical protein
MGGTCSMHESDDKCLQILVRKPEAKKVFRKPRHKRREKV